MNKNYNIIAIEPNASIKLAYENKFGNQIKVYRDKKSFDKACQTHEIHHFKQYAPLVFVMETSFSEELENRLDDAPNKNTYPERMFEKLTDEEKEKKSINIGLGIRVAEDIREGKYGQIPKNMPIIFATWLGKYGASRDITIPNAYHVPKDSVIKQNKIYADEKLLCEKLEQMLNTIYK